MNSKYVLALILGYFLITYILFSLGYKAIKQLEASAVSSIELWCGPETASRFKKERERLGY